MVKVLKGTRASIPLPDLHTLVSTVIKDMFGGFRALEVPWEGHLLVVTYSEYHSC